MSKREMAALFGSMTDAKKITTMIRTGVLRVIPLSRQQFIFDKRDLPPEVREKLKHAE